MKASYALIQQECDVRTILSQVKNLNGNIFCTGELLAPSFVQKESLTQCNNTSLTSQERKVLTCANEASPSHHGCNMGTLFRDSSGRRNDKIKGQDQNPVDNSIVFIRHATIL